MFFIYLPNDPPVMAPISEYSARDTTLQGLEDFPGIVDCFRDYRVMYSGNDVRHLVLIRRLISGSLPVSSLQRDRLSGRSRYLYSCLNVVSPVSEAFARPASPNCPCLCSSSLCWPCGTSTKSRVKKTANKPISTTYISARSIDNNIPGADAEAFPVASAFR